VKKNRKNVQLCHHKRLVGYSHFKTCVKKDNTVFLTKSIFFETKNVLTVEGIARDLIDHPKYQSYAQFVYDVFTRNYNHFENGLREL